MDFVMQGDTNIQKYLRGEEGGLIWRYIEKRVKVMWVTRRLNQNAVNVNRGWLCELLGFEIWQGGITRKWVGSAQSLSPIIEIYWERDSKNDGETSQKLEWPKDKSFKQTHKIWWSHTELPPPSPSLSNIFWPNNGKAKPSNERKS